MKQNRKQPIFSFRQSGETLELYIYDEIKSDKDKEFNWETWSYDEPEVSAKKVREILESNGNAKALDIYVNSNGGDVFEAYAMASMIQRFAGYKTCYIDGMAASAASLIPMVCDKVVMASYASILIHNMWTVACGNAKELRETADMLDDLMKSNRQLYLSRFNAGEDKLIELMDAETWMNAKEAVKLGFADEILFRDGEKSVPEDTADAEMLFSRKAVTDSLLSRLIPKKKPEANKHMVPVTDLEKRLSLLAH